MDINGQHVEPSQIERAPTGKRRGGLRGQRITISLADCPPFHGDNELGLTLKFSGDRKELPYMEELEIVVNEELQPSKSH